MLNTIECDSGRQRQGPDDFAEAAGMNSNKRPPWTGVKQEKTGVIEGNINF
jgi:hypothetical protein